MLALNKVFISVICTKGTEEFKADSCVACFAINKMQIWPNFMTELCERHGVLQSVSMKSAYIE